MAGFGSNTNDTATTPSRVVHVTWDLAETVVVDPAFGMRRTGPQIAPALASSVGTSADVLLLASGAWSIAPKQLQLANLHERTDSAAAVMRLSQFSAPGFVKEKTTSRVATELIGMTDSADPALAAAATDLFLTFRRSAGANWNAGLTSALPKPVLPTANLPLERVLEANVTHPADQGYFLRWVNSGKRTDQPDWTHTFYFGGVLTTDGYGAYALSFSGSGICTLFEWVAAAWKQRDSWQYATPGSVMDASHTLRIIPHGQKFIEFVSQVSDRPAPAPLFSPRAMRPGDARGAPTTYLYVVSKSVTGRTILGPTVTGPGTVKLDVRRSCVPDVQISRLLYPSLGTLVDHPFQVPWASGSAANMTIRTRAYVPVGGIVAQLYNAETGALLGTGGDGGYVLPGARNAIHARFLLQTTDETRSPLLWSYQVTRPAVTTTSAPGTKTGGVVQELSITGPEQDPSHETAQLSIADLTNQLSVLRTRAMMPVKIETEYDAADPTKRAGLMSGYLARCEAKKAGKTGNQGLAGQGVLIAYPSPEWRDLECQLVGPWVRLEEQLLWQQEDFAEDPDAPADAYGQKQPYKITDVIRKLIGAAGYPSSQIDVPDLQTRLFYTPGDSYDTIRPTPFTRVGSYLQNLALSYLGGFLLWDLNAGAAGMWRLRLGPKAGTALWNWVTTAPAAGKLRNRPESYAASTSLIEDLTTWVSPPEANAVCVTATGELLANKAGQNRRVAWAINYKSFNPPGYALADPNHPDYLGRFVPIVVTDPSLGEPQMVDFMARRIYNIACVALKMAAWSGPLVLVTDPSDAQLAGKRRPLRFGDTVTIDGASYLIRSVNPLIHKSAHQEAYYEAQLVTA